MSGRKKIVFTALILAIALGMSGCGHAERQTARADTEEDTTRHRGSLPTIGGASESDDVSSDPVSWDKLGETEEVGSPQEDADAPSGSAQAEETAEPAQSAPDDGGADAAESGDGITYARYAYQTLTDEEQVVYDEIVAAFSDRAEEARISTTDPAVLEQAYLAVRSDYCGFFWVEELAYVIYSRGDVVTSIAIRPVYTMTEEEQADKQSRIDAEADRMLADAPVDGGDYEKALYVYETLIREVDYDVNAADGQTIVSVFLNHATVCQGYSYATQYLLERLGIPAATVTGTADGEPHAWNLVLLDGEYYFIDTTWGNSEYVNRNDQGAEEIIPYKYVNYDYFCVTTEMLSATHQPDGDILLPVCVATADNYYVHEGLYIDTWDPDRVGEILRRGWQDGESIVRIRFSDRGLYDQAVQYFLDEGNLFSYCDGLRSVRYLESPESNVMVVVFP